MAVCVMQFCLGLILVTRAGEYFFQVFDWYATATSIVIIATVEVICISYVYGAKRLFKHAETMLGPRRCFSRYLWITLWYAVTPAFTLIIFVSMIVDYKPPVFSNGEEFPDWTIVLGWCLACISIVPIPITAAIAIFRNRHNLKQVDIHPLSRIRLVSTQDSLNRFLGKIT